MAQYQKFLNQFYKRIAPDNQLDSQFKQEFELICTHRVVEKGELIFEEGSIASEAALNLNGLFRTFSTADNLSISFSKPLSIIPSIAYIKEEKKIPFSVEALTNCHILVFSQREIRELIHNDFRWYRIIWNLLQEELAEEESKRISLLVDPAPLRYKKFLDSFGSLERFIKISHVASYLGMASETLSRIRSKDWDSVL